MSSKTSNKQYFNYTRTRMSCFPIKLEETICLFVVVNKLYSMLNFIPKG